MIKAYALFLTVMTERLDSIAFKLSDESLGKIAEVRSTLEKELVNLPMLFNNALWSRGEEHSSCKSVIVPPALERLVLSELTAERLRKLFGDNDNTDRWGADPMDLMRFFPAQNLRPDFARYRQRLSMFLWNFSCGVEALSRWVSPEED